MPQEFAPTTKEEARNCRHKYQVYTSQPMQTLSSSIAPNLSTLSEIKGAVSPTTPHDYSELTPLISDLVDITEPLANTGLVTVELCGGPLASTEALVRSGVEICRMHVCELDFVARQVALARLRVLNCIFSGLMPSDVVKNYFSLLPQDVRMITQQHIQSLGRFDLFICGFPCHGFSRASEKAFGLNDPRSAVLHGRWTRFVC